MAERIIEVDDSDEVKPWSPPPVGGEELAAAEREAAPRLPTVEEIEAIQQAAHQEGWQAGYEAGLAEGREAGRAEGYEAGFAEGQKAGLAELRAQGERLQALLETLEAPLQALDEAVAEQLAELAMMVARHLVRRELKTDSGVVVSLVREAVALLPVGARNIRVFLHPEDAALVRRALAVDEGEEARWRIVEEPTLTRGGCRVQSDDSRIDATVESRLGALIAHALGGERSDDAPAETARGEAHGPPQESPAAPPESREESGEEQAAPPSDAPRADTPPAGEAEGDHAP